MLKSNKYPTMQCNQTVKCPCYKGDGYRYCFDAIEFLFCEVCNQKLLNQMVEQFKLEQGLKELNNDIEEGLVHNKDGTATWRNKNGKKAL
jgi:hypothetical protein